MKVLIADDDRVTRRMLESVVSEWGYEPILASEGRAAFEVLCAADPPPLAILDWLMPEMDGLEVCRRLRALPVPVPTYLLLLTVKGSRQDIVAGLRSGADDYVSKPFDLEELHARLHTGLRIVDLQRKQAEQLRQMEEALTRIKKLQGLLPICCYCKQIRDGENSWQAVEAYISNHADVRFSHGICPACIETRLKPELDKYLGESHGPGSESKCLA